MNKRKGPSETWSVNYECYRKIEILSCADSLYFRLSAERRFVWMKILLILPKFHEKTLKTFWRYQNFSSREEDVHAHCPPIYGRSVK